VGLSGGFGTVKLGRNSTYLNSDMEKVDPWIYGAGVNGMSTLTFNDGRVNNSIRYDAPQFVPGLKLSALYGFDEQRNATKNDGSRANAGVYSLGIGYENSGFYGDLGYYGQLDQGNGSDHTAYYWRAEGGYNANNLLVALAYQETKAYLGSSVQVAGLNPSNFISEVPAGVGTAGGVKQNEFAITVGYTIGAFTPMASYSKGYDVKVDNYKVNDSGYDQWVIGSNYALSKRTNAYLSYGQKKWDSNIANVLGGGDKENTLAIGLQHKF
jgi:predicted porin